MKKLGVTLLAVAFSLPMFAAARTSHAKTATTQSQTKTKKKVVKHHKMRHAKKHAAAKK